MDVFYTFAEVYKAKCEGKGKPLSENEERNVARFLENEFIVPVLVDRRIATLARKLMRTHSGCAKPQDAVHLATALVSNVEEMHTYDGSDLLDLNGLIARDDGHKLVICKPYVILADLFDERRNEAPNLETKDSEPKEPLRIEHKPNEEQPPAAGQ